MPKRSLARLDEDVSHFILRDASLDLSAGRLMPLVSTPRSLDLVHLRTAMWFHERERIDRFVPLDERQAIAARELGLPA